MATFSRIGLAVLLVFGAARPASAEPIRYPGERAELCISAVGERTIRIVLAPLDEKGKARPASPSTVLMDFASEQKLRRQELAGAEVLSVGKLRVQLRPQPLTVSVQTPSGKFVQELVFGQSDGSVRFRATAPVLGMGEGAKQFDRRSVAYTMRDGWGAFNLPLYGSWVAVPLLIGTGGWAMFIHEPRGQFDLRKPEASFKPAEDQRELPLDLFLIAWDQPADVLAEYVRLTGRTPLPPRWALGYMQSHRTLSGPDEVLQVARTFRDKKLPCDALIYLGTGYCPAGWNRGHGSLQFNPKTFDRPAEMVDTLHRLHFHVILHQNRAPRDLSGTSVTDAAAVPLLARPADSAPNASSPGASKQGHTIADYWNRHRPVFALGVDGWWPDDGDELPHEARLARHRMYYEGPLADRPNVRPWSLHRTGYAGVQRYGGWMWSGDIDSRWETLAAQVAVGQNHSLSLTPFWGTDVGGFVPKKELTGELYVRWFQFGAFCPSFRAHGRTWHLRLPWGWNTGELGPMESKEGPDAGELRNAQVEPICRKYLELRYRLLPYNYTLCREAHDTGLPLIRALWLHYPNDPRAVTRSDEYLWGRELLVAPVTAKGATERRLYLPEGDWYDFWTRERLAGGRELARKVDLATLPLFVRAGAILPLDPPRQYTAQPAEEPTTVRIYSGRDGSFRWYDDDGESLNYLQGKFTWTRLTWKDRERRLTIQPDGAAGFLPVDKTLVIEVLPDGRRQTVRYTGRPVEIGF